MSDVHTGFSRAVKRGRAASRVRTWSCRSWISGFRDFAKFGGVIEDGADGAEADFRVLILRVLILGEVAEVNDSLKGEALEAAFGDLGGLAL